MHRCGMLNQKLMFYVKAASFDTATIETRLFCWKNKMTTENINQAHRETIGASQTHRIMSYLQHDNLPKGAVSLIEVMCRGTDEDLENAYELNTTAVRWGRDHEVEAVELIAAEFGAEIQFYGENQLRLNAGFEYSNIISALCDAHLIMADGSIIIPEIKCLDTKNHDYIIAAVGDSAEALKREDWAKYCQVHTQNICAETYYEKSVSSIIVFYDPRSTVKKLHYIVVVDADDYMTIDVEFRNKLKQRAKLARNLYDSIKAEPDRAPVIYDGVMPETKLVKASNDFILTPALLETGCEEIARKVAESVGVEIVDLVIENDKVVSYHLKGGEVFDCEVKEGRELSEKMEKRIKKIIPLVKKANAPLREKALSEHRKYTKTDRLIESLITPIVGHIGSKRAEWESEQRRIQDEILATEAEKKRLADEQAEQVKMAILAKIETFTVLPQDVSSLELIAAKRLQVESVVVDVMFGEFHQQAVLAKDNALAALDNAELSIKQAIEEAAKQTRLDKLNEFRNKCKALHDDTHSVEYLTQQRFKLFNVVPSTEAYHEHYDAVCECRLGTLDALDKVLITAAKQRAIDLAEKLKDEAEQKKINNSMELNQSDIRIDRYSADNQSDFYTKKTTTVRATHLPTGTIAECNSEKSEWSNAEKAVESLKEIVGYSTEQTYIDDKVNRVLNNDIIAMYEAMNPVLHAKVIEAAGKAVDFQKTPQNSRSSFLHNLFDNDKQGKALRAAFCLIIK